MSSSGVCSVSLNSETVSQTLSTRVLHLDTLITEHQINSEDTFRLVSSHVMRIVHNTTMNTQVIKWIGYSLSFGSSFTLVGVSLLSRSSRSPLSFLSFLLFLCLGLLDLLRLLDRFSFLTFRSLSESLHIKIKNE